MTELRPDSSDEELYEYFYNNLPPELSKEFYEMGLACTGFARLIIMKLGGPDKARAYWIRHFANTGHVYVVPKESQPRNLAYNNVNQKKLTIHSVLQRGADITDEIFNSKWEELG